MAQTKAASTSFSLPTRPGSSTPKASLKSLIHPKRQDTPKQPSSGKTGLRLSFSLTNTTTHSPKASPRYSAATAASKSIPVLPLHTALTRSLHSAAKPTEIHIDLHAEAGFPITPSEALRLYAGQMSEYEKNEVTAYPLIYYMGKTEGRVEDRKFDDGNGNYQVNIGDQIQYRYEIMEVLGKGSFGIVVKAVDHKLQETVAVKVIRNKKKYHQQGMVEVKVLKLLGERDAQDRMGVVRLKDCFLFRQHLCLVFELLSQSLFDCLRSTHFTGLSLNLIRRVAIQLIIALRYIRANRVIHCDLKPENVLLKQANKSAVKVIDFGSACLETEKVYTYIQSRFYRAPEIILGAPYTASIDMWSLGCLLAELHTGRPLFAGDSEHDQLMCMMEVPRVPPVEVLARSTRKKLFFDGEAVKVVPNRKGKRRIPGTVRLEDALRSPDPSFTDFICQCLQWDSASRLCPDHALQHTWVVTCIAQIQQSVAGAESVTR